MRDGCDQRWDERLHWLFGERCGGEDVGEDAIGGEAFELGFGLEDEAVAEGWQGSLLDVVGDEEVAAIAGGVGFGDEEKAGGGAR